MPGWTGLRGIVKSSMAYDYGLMKRLSEVAGIPGREERVRELIRAELGELASGAVTDAMGNLIVTVKGPEGAPTVLVSAHMDEIGFVIRHIDSDGFIRVQNLGGFDTRNLFARFVTVHGRGGNERTGVLHPGVKPIHISTPEERNRLPEVHDFVVDLGLPAETVKAEFRIGDMVTLQQPFQDLGEVISGKALDDRTGCWILVHALKQLDNPQVTVIGMFSTQEEVGLRGATVGAFSQKPDLGIALDTTLAVDTPGTPDHLSVTRLGEGVGIKVSDSSAISNGWLVDAMADLAAEHGIRHQFEVLPRGGTDAGGIQRSRGGVASVTLSTPSRYVHTVTEMVAKGDLESTVRLLVEFLQSDAYSRSPAG